MICLSPFVFAMFLQMARVEVVASYPLVTVMSDQPRLYVMRGGAFCFGGVAI